MKKFIPYIKTRIREIGEYGVKLSNGQLFAPPPGYILDCADAEQGIYSYHSEEGKYRNWVFGGQSYSEFIPDSYFVRLDSITIQKI